MSSYFVPDSFEGGKLESEINSRYPMLGNTKEGSDWVMKMLNPSAPIMPVGIPDTTTVDIVPVNYDYVTEIGPPPNISANDSWNCTINFHANPIAIFDYVISRSSVPGDVSYSRTHLNKEIPLPPNSVRPIIPPGTNYLETNIINDTFDYIKKIETYRTMYTRDRQMYAGITFVPNQSSQYDEGLCVVTKVNQSPEKDSVLNTISGGNITRYLYTRTDFADFDTAMQSSSGRAHIGEAKFGAYTRIGMDEKYVDFKSTTSNTCIESQFFYGETVSGTVSKPLPATFVTIENGTSGLANRGRQMSQIFFKDLAPTTSFMVRVRIGYEGLLFPESMIAPFRRRSPDYDPKAIEVAKQLELMYMKDGYPHAWNSMGWLTDAISKVAQTGLGAAQGFMTGGPAGAVAGGLGGLVNSFKKQPRRNNNYSNQNDDDYENGDEEEEEPPRKNYSKRNRQGIQYKKF